MSTRKLDHKHKEVTLVVLSYIIGFTTAMILFGLTNKTDSVYVYKNDVVQTPTSFVKSEEKISVIDTEEGLFMSKKNGENRLLSAAVALATDPYGFHYVIVTSTISPNQNFVHYCSQLAPDSESCLHFVYSVSEDTTYPVTNGTQLESLISSVNARWENEGYLNIEGARSISVETPWRVN